MITKIPVGALTAIVTPFKEDREIDWSGLKSLVDFQVSQGISGIVPVGTTGESPTLTEFEHEKVLSSVIGLKNIFVLAGCGSNSTAEAMHYVRKTAEAGGKAVLLVDSYYNKPPSLALRREYYEPIARAFPDIAIVPYIIPGRTCCALLPEDLAILNQKFPNIYAVKEATGDLQNMIRIRSLTFSDFQIFSGDDDKTFRIMIDNSIRSCGVISVISNIAPAAVQEMCQAILRHDIKTAETVRDKLEPFFKIVTVSVDRMIDEKTTVVDKFPNPMAIKVAMNLLGMPAGPCRQPLGRMTRAGADKVSEALITVWSKNPDVLSPIADFFNINIDERLMNRALLENLVY